MPSQLTSLRADSEFSDDINNNCADFNSLLSGGADSSIVIWDLETSLGTTDASYVPLSSVHR